MCEWMIASIRRVRVLPCAACSQYSIDFFFAFFSLVRARMAVHFWICCHPVYKKFFCVRWGEEVISGRFLSAGWREMEFFLKIKLRQHPAYLMPSFFFWFSRKRRWFFWLQILYTRTKTSAFFHLWFFCLVDARAIEWRRSFSEVLFSGNAWNRVVTRRNLKMQDEYW